MQTKDRVEADSSRLQSPHHVPACLVPASVSASVSAVLISASRWRWQINGAIAAAWHCGCCPA